MKLTPEAIKPRHQNRSCAGAGCGRRSHGWRRHRRARRPPRAGDGARGGDPCVRHRTRGSNGRGCGAALPADADQSDRTRSRCGGTPRGGDGAGRGPTRPAASSRLEHCQGRRHESARWRSSRAARSRAAALSAARRAPENERQSPEVRERSSFERICRNDPRVSRPGTTVAASAPPGIAQVRTLWVRSTTPAISKARHDEAGLDATMARNDRRDGEARIPAHPRIPLRPQSSVLRRRPSSAMPLRPGESVTVQTPLKTPSVDSSCHQAVLSTSAATWCMRPQRRRLDRSRIEIAGTPAPGSHRPRIERAMCRHRGSRGKCSSPIGAATDMMAWLVSLACALASCRCAGVCWHHRLAHGGTTPSTCIPEFAASGRVRGRSTVCRPLRSRRWCGAARAAPERRAGSRTDRSKSSRAVSVVPSSSRNHAWARKGVRAPRAAATAAASYAHPRS